MKKKKMSIEEYRTLRTEILQYLQNYQNIRNMMYVASLAMLGFFIDKNMNPLYFLSPSVIIIPSYLVSVNYWQCADKISTYITVFWEKEKNGFNWENRNVEFGILCKNVTKIDMQLFPYIAMEFFCLFLYFLHINYNGEDKYWYIISGILLIFLSLYIFNYFHKDMRDKYIRCWNEMKEKELRSEEL